VEPASLRRAFTFYAGYFFIFFRRLSIDIMKLRAPAVTLILIVALAASGCCVCCIPTGTAGSDSQANEYAQPEYSQASSDADVLPSAYAGVGETRAPAASPGQA
jgi:hypothetical protein